MRERFRVTSSKVLQWSPEGKSVFARNQHSFYAKQIASRMSLLDNWRTKNVRGLRVFRKQEEADERYASTLMGDDVLIGRDLSKNSSREFVYVPSWLHPATASDDAA
jgi:hypothetical protein